MPYPCNLYYTEEEERRAKKENPKYLYESDFIANKVLLKHKESLAKMRDLNFALQMECRTKQQYGSDNFSSQNLENSQKINDSLDIKELSTGFNGLLSRQAPETTSHPKQSNPTQPIRESRSRKMRYRKPSKSSKPIPKHQCASIGKV